MSSVGSSVRSGSARPAMRSSSARAGRQAQLEGRQADGRERRIEERREGDVVEADDRHVVGHAQAGLADRGDRPEGDDVAGDERGVDRGRGRGARPSPGGRCRRRTRPRRRGRRRRRCPAASSADAVAVEPFLGGGVGERRVRDAGDPPLAEADQVLDRPPGAADVVDVDARDVEPGQRALEDDREAVAGEAGEARVVDARPGDDEAVGVLGPEQRLVRAAVGVERLDHDPEAGRSGRPRRGRAASRPGRRRRRPARPTGAGRSPACGSCRRPGSRAGAWGW